MNVEPPYLCTEGRRDFDSKRRERTHGRDGALTFDGGVRHHAPPREGCSSAAGASARQPC
jgi:hypothetical protein